MARVVIPGGSGYLGTAVARVLVRRGDEVVVLTRGRPGMREGVRFVQWDGRRVDPTDCGLDGADAVVHLTGQRVDGRPTRAHVDELIASRVGPVVAVGRALARCAAPPPVWVQLSTLAIFGDTNDEVVVDGAHATVPSGIGPRQMVTVALAWESAYREATRDVPRAVLLRAGIGLGGDDDPATRRLRQLVRLGLGGPVAGGGQWVSWVALDDLVRAMVDAIDRPEMSGTYHVTSPHPVTNAEMMATYRALLGRRLGLPAPRPVTHLGAWLLGSDPALALTGRRAVPVRLPAEGFRFATPHFRDAAARALGVVGEPAGADPVGPDGTTGARGMLPRVRHPQDRSTGAPRSTTSPT